MFKIFQEKEGSFFQNFEALLPGFIKELALWGTLKLRLEELSSAIKTNLPLIKKALAGLLAGVVFILLLVIIRSSLHFGEIKPPVFPTPTPTPFEEEIKNPSIYATDSAVLEIEGRLKTIGEDLDLVDLKETSINPPVLDMEVNFKE